MTRQELRCFLRGFFCDCGDPPAATEALCWLLETWEDRDKAMYLELPKKIQDDGMQWLMCYFVNQLHLIEHGGGVMASWLTGKGSEVLAALRRERVDGFKKLHESYCKHGYDVSGPDGHDCAAHEGRQMTTPDRQRGARECV